MKRGRRSTPAGEHRAVLLDQVLDVLAPLPGETVTIQMRDGRLVAVDPPGVVGHLNYGFGPSRGRPAFL